MKLFKDYNTACDKLAAEFIKRYYGEEADGGDWVADEAGGVLYVNDDYWDFKDILTALKENVPSATLFKWYSDQVDFYSGRELEKDEFPNLRGYMWREAHPRKATSKLEGWDKDPL